MSTERDMRRDFMIAGIVFLAGACLIALSLPRMFSAAQLAKVPFGIDEALKDGKDLKSAVVTAALERYRRAVEAKPGDALTDQDFARLELRIYGMSELAPDQRAAALRSASDHLMAAIAAGPARSFPWTLLAYVKAEQAASPADIADLLRMSYFLGPHEASSMLLRLRIGSGMWERLPPDVQGNTRRDIAEVWSIPALHPVLVDLYLKRSFAVRAEMLQVIFALPRGKEIFNYELSKFIGPAAYH